MLNISFDLSIFYQFIEREYEISLIIWLNCPINDFYYIYLSPYLIPKKWAVLFLLFRFKGDLLIVAE